MRKLLRTFAAAATVAMLATACADAPDETEEPTEDTTDDGASEEDEGTDEESEEPTEEAAAVTACQVTDTGGVDDRSFNQTAFEGLERAEEELGITARVLESTSEADFAPNIQTFVDEDCDLIVTVGFLLDAATQAAAQANPDQKFAIIDVDFAEFDEEGNFVQDITYDNVRELTFATDQAAFLAGYLAAGMTETGVVGTYGGINIPPVTIFMNGFLAGVLHYNDVKGADVEVLGWDGTDGLFTGNFESQEDGRNLTDQLLAGDADIIMPVAGPVGLGTTTAVEDANAAGANAKVIWVDTDGYVSVPQAQDLFLTSVQKRMDNAVYDQVERVVNDNFEGGLYIGTLENEGVGIAPFHDYEDAVPQELKDELDQLRADIIGGMSVSPADYGA